MEQLAAGGYTDPLDPANNLRPEKVISESGVLLLAASTSSHVSAIAGRVRALVQRLAPHARSDRMLMGICTEPTLAWDYAQAHMCLTRLGYPDGRFDSALQLVTGAQARGGRERPPHRVLEQLWTTKGGNVSAAFQRSIERSATRSARESILGQSMDLLSSSREDVYAFTHALMFVADFNIRPWRLPRARSAVLADAEAALARCLDDQDYDLAGEVLLSWPLTGRSWGPSAAFAFRVLARVEDAAGFLPSAGTRLDHLEKLDGTARNKYLIASAYHTAYVMGLLCAMALQPRRAPPITIPHTRHAQEVWRRLLELLDAAPERPHWREQLDQLTEMEREGLAGILLMIGLRRSVAQRDFARLRDYLEIGSTAGIANMPMASQAAEFLSRLAHVSPMLGAPRAGLTRKRLAHVTERSRADGGAIFNQRSRPIQLGR